MRGRARFLWGAWLAVILLSPAASAWQGNGITVSIGASQTADDATDAITVDYRGTGVNDPFTDGAEQVYGVYGAGSSDYLNGEPSWRVFSEMTVEVTNGKETDDGLVRFILEVRLDETDWYTVHSAFITVGASTTVTLKPGAAVNIDPIWADGGEKAEFHWKVGYDTSIVEETDAPYVYLQLGDAPTPTPSPTATFTPIPPTATPTTPAAQTPTPTFTPLGGGTNTPTNTPAGGPTATSVPTNTYTPVTPPTPTPGNTPTPTFTPTKTPTFTPTGTATSVAPTSTPPATPKQYTDDDIYEIIWRPPSRFDSFLDIEGAARANVWGVSATLSALPAAPTATIFGIVYRWQEGDTVRVRNDEVYAHYWYDRDGVWVPQYKHSEWQDVFGGVIRPATENSAVLMKGEGSVTVTVEEGFPDIVHIDDAPQNIWTDIYDNFSGLIYPDSPDSHLKLEAHYGSIPKAWVDNATYPRRLVIEMPGGDIGDSYDHFQNARPRAYPFIGRGDLEPIQILSATGSVIHFDPASIRVETEGGTKTRWPALGEIAGASFDTKTRFAVSMSYDGYGEYIVPLHRFTFPYRSHNVIWYYVAPDPDVLPPLDIPPEEPSWP